MIETGSSDFYNSEHFTPRYRTSQDRVRACTPLPALSYRAIVRNISQVQQNDTEDEIT